MAHGGKAVAAVPGRGRVARGVAGDRVAVDAGRLRAGAATGGGGRERECRARATRRGAVTAEPARGRARRTRACAPRSEPAARRPRARGQARSRPDRRVDRGCRAEWRGARGARGTGVAGELAPVLLGPGEGGSRPRRRAFDPDAARAPRAADRGGCQTRSPPARDDRSAGVPRTPGVARDPALLGRRN